MPHVKCPQFNLESMLDWWGEFPGDKILLSHPSWFYRSYMWSEQLLDYVGGFCMCDSHEGNLT